MGLNKRTKTISYTVDDYFISYREYTKDNSAYAISRDKFTKIVKDYFKFLSEELICNAKEVRLPARMGILSVIKIKPRGYARRFFNVDFKSTLELEKTVLHLNEHSGGYRFRFFWNKGDMLITNKSMYELVMSRANKRRLAYMIKVEKKDYIER